MLQKLLCSVEVMLYHPKYPKYSKGQISPSLAFWADKHLFVFYTGLSALLLSALVTALLCHFGL